MIDIFAALSLAAAATKSPSADHLFEDSSRLYQAYLLAKEGRFNAEQLANSGQLKPLVESAARLAAVASFLVDDPTQMKNLILLLASI